MTCGRRPAALFLAVVAALLATAGPAVAQRVAVDDATGDVWSPPPGQSGWTVEGSIVNTDVVRTIGSHTRTAVTLKVEYQDLRKRRSDEIQFRGYLRDDQKRYRNVLVSVDWLGRDSSTVLVGGRSQFGPRNACDGMSSRADFRRNFIRVTIPRTCIGRPRWVRFAGLAESYREQTGLFVDSATDPGHRVTTWSGRVARG